MKNIIIIFFFFVALMSCEKREYCLDCHIRVYDIADAPDVSPSYQVDTVMCGFDDDSYSYSEKISPRLVYVIQCQE